MEKFRVPLLLLVVVVDAVCPNGWVAKLNGGACFKAFCEQLTQEESDAACKVHGGRLAKIEDHEQNILITRISKGTSWRWIGLSELESRGTWKWQDGAALEYSSWHQSQPGNEGGGQQCVMANLGTDWADIPCGFKSPFVCRLDRSGSSDSSEAPANTSGVSWNVVAGNVCFGAKGDSHDTFELASEATSIKLVHKSGFVTCCENGCDECRLDNWGSNRGKINVWVTRSKRDLVAPFSGSDAKAKDAGHYFYRPGEGNSVDVDGLGVNSKQLEFRAHFPAGSYQLWYGQDIKDVYEHDNDGTSCVSVESQYSKAHLELYAAMEKASCESSCRTFSNPPCSGICVDEPGGSCGREEEDHKRRKDRKGEAEYIPWYLWLVAFLVVVIIAALSTCIGVFCCFRAKCCCFQPVPVAHSVAGPGSYNIPSQAAIVGQPVNAK